MKKTITLICVLFMTGLIKAQTTFYADSVIAFSSEYNNSGWSVQGMKGAPDVYPTCGDTPGAWAFVNSNLREWVNLHYSTPLYVDSVYIYETNNSGTVDTVYLRNALTQTWNVVYSGTANPVSSCSIFKIGFSTTTYPVDAVRFTVSESYFGTVIYPEFDAVALVGTPAPIGIKSISNNKIPDIYPNPCSTTFSLNTKGRINENICLVDLLGNIVLKKTIAKEIESFSVDKLTNGIYFVRFEDGSSKKILIEK